MGRLDGPRAKRVEWSVTSVPFNTLRPSEPAVTLGGGNLFERGVDAFPPRANSRETIDK